MRMKIAPECDEVVFVPVQPAEDRLGHLRRHAGRPDRAGSRASRAPARMT
jgi:hypothetical protein